MYTEMTTNDVAYQITSVIVIVEIVHMPFA